MLKFKELGVLTTFNEVDISKTIFLPKGEWWSVYVPNLSDCDKVAIVECSLNLDCEQENIIGNKSCFRRPPYNNMSWVGLIIEDFDVLPKFTLYSTDDEGNKIDLFTFDGGTIEELVDSHDEIEVTPSGVNIYFEAEFAGTKAEISTDSIYLSSATYCLNRVNKVGIDFSICEEGCYRIAIYRKEVAVAVSNKITVVANNDNNNLGAVVEYIVDDMYYRHRMPFYFLALRYETEETEKQLSDGNFSITDSIVRPYLPFKTDLLSNKEHLEILSILKGSSFLKVNGEEVYFRGSYNTGDEGVDKKYSANGNLYLKNRTSIFGSGDCSANQCNSDSTFTYDIFEKEKEGSFLLAGSNL